MPARTNNAEARNTMQHYMALVKDCYRSKDSRGALQVLDLLQKENRVQPDTQLLNYILLVCVAAGSKDMTQRLFNVMEKSGCADLVTYNTVLKSFVESEDLASAETLLRRMQNNPNISPDGVTFNLMVNACVVCRQHEKAWDYIEKIKAAKLTVDVCEDVLLLSTCLDACARLGECGLLRNLLTYFEKSDLRLNAHAYGTVIKAYGRLGDMDRITYSSIIKGLCCSNVPHGLEVALQLFDNMQQRAHIKADAIIYNTLIQGAATRKRVQLVELLLQHMIDHGVPPSSYTLCQCVKLHEYPCSALEERQREEDVHVPPQQRKLRRHRLSPQSRFQRRKRFTIGKCNNLQRVLELHRELPARFHFRADEYVHTAMIAACAQNGAPLLAARVAVQACTAGQQLSATMLRKVLLDLQQRRQRAEEEVGESDPEASRAAVDSVIEELKQLIWRRHGQDPQQVQETCHSPTEQPREPPAQQPHPQQHKPAPKQGEGQGERTRKKPLLLLRRQKASSCKVHMSGKGPAQKSQAAKKTAGKSLGPRYRRRKRTESFALYIYKVLKQVHPETGVSKKSMSIMNSFINDIFDRLADEAVRLIRYNKKHERYCRTHSTSNHHTSVHPATHKLAGSTNRGAISCVPELLPHTRCFHQFLGRGAMPPTESDFSDKKKLLPNIVQPYT
ncbi:UNVERIFIED_CONTAM: hypothetical protein H355_009339 [Colinus virginianus]|nr:hypothetical protein H355_009339 [Colinus virginianus]